MGMYAETLTAEARRVLATHVLGDYPLVYELQRRPRMAIVAGTIYRGVLRAFDAGTYLARVTLTGSLKMSLSSVPVARDIAAGELTAGRFVAVVLFDETKSTDAAVLAVWT